MRKSAVLLLLCGGCLVAVLQRQLSQVELRASYAERRCEELDVQIVDLRSQIVAITAIVNGEQGTH